MAGADCGPPRHIAYWNNSSDRAEEYGSKQSGRPEQWDAGSPSL